ncbi:MAG: hypothetical protein HYY16_11120 [Planctomycetes bacterium]|nr:hypothetical protein [Planctomycetota bacterium]
MTEREWLEGEVRLAASLTDADRIRILRDLLRTVDAIRRTKTPEELKRDDEVRRLLDDDPARERYVAWAERWA